MQDVAITGFAVHVPGWSADQLPGSGPERATGPDEAHLVVGRKGLLAKESATRLALCAVHRALGLPLGRRPEAADAAPRTAVVASSNLGNAATVCAIIDTVDADGGGAVSVLQAPNASSNIVASSVAIRFGFTGPNHMVCSGSTSGLDAIRLGAMLLHTGRADRVVVVGVEPDDEVTRSLRPAWEWSLPPTAGAACVVLEPVGARPPERVWPDGGQLLLGPVCRAWNPECAGWPMLGPHSGSDGVCLTDLIGDTYGAHGVLQVAVAAALLSGEPTGALAAAGAAVAPGRHGRVSGTLVCGDAEDGYAWTRLTHVAGRRADPAIDLGNLTAGAARARPARRSPLVGTAR